jgi:hypothetical protein
MADTAIDVNWQIQPATETNEVDANRFDQHREGNMKFGPEPESPGSAPPETSGQ